MICNRLGALRVLALGMSCMAAAMPAAAKEPDWSSYAEILKKHTSEQVQSGIPLIWVNYSALKSDPLWPKVVAGLAGYDPAQLQGRQEEIAFYSNAYNILTIKKMVDNWPVRNIRDLGGKVFNQVWDQPAGEIGGKTYTLGQIEHGILRKKGEPRIHFAITCASKGCPDLRREPYTAAKLDQQLEEQTRRYLNNAAKGLRVEGGKVRVSKIFDWFERDFKAVGGIDSFIRRYRRDLPTGAHAEPGIDYDWTANGA